MPLKKQLEKQPKEMIKALLLFATPRFIQTHFNPWITYIIEEGTDLHVASSWTDKDASSLPNEATLHLLPCRRTSLNPFHVFQEALALRHLLSKEKPDTLHLFGWRMIFLGLVAAFGPKPARIYCFITGLGSIFQKEAFLWQMGRRFFLCTLRFFFWALKPELWAENETDLSFLAKSLGVPPKRRQLIPGAGLHLKHFYPAPLPVSEPLILGYCGRLIRDKGLAELIKVIETINKDKCRVQVKLAGEIDPDNPSSFKEEDTATWCKMRGVILCGHISQSEIPEFWESVHVAILPSYAEGLPKMLLEASAMGRPAIATDVSGCRAVISPHQNGLLVLPKSTDAVHQAIEHYTAMNRQEIEQQGKTARKIVEERFSFQQVAKILQKKYT